MPHPFVQFRVAGEVGDHLRRRASGRPLGGIARRDLERYYALLAQSLRRIALSQDEASLIAVACNGVLWTPQTVDLIWAEVDEAIRADRLDQQWGVDGPALVDLLRALGPAERLALVDAVEHLWTLVGQGDPRPLPELLRAVGLVG
jgi:hypothetical protein